MNPGGCFLEGDLSGWPAWIRTRAKGSKVLRATTTQRANAIVIITFGHVSGNNLDMVLPVSNKIQTLKENLEIDSNVYLLSLGCGFVPIPQRHAGCRLLSARFDPVSRYGTSF